MLILFADPKQLHVNIRYYKCHTYDCSMLDAISCYRATLCVFRERIHNSRTSSSPCWRLADGESPLFGMTYGTSRKICTRKWCDSYYRGCINKSSFKISQSFGGARSVVRVPQLHWNLAAVSAALPRPNFKTIHFNISRLRDLARSYDKTY